VAIHDNEADQNYELWGIAWDTSIAEDAAQGWSGFCESILFFWQRTCGVVLHFSESYYRRLLTLLCSRSRDHFEGFREPRKLAR
jgi:hypothetical protein